MLRPEPTETGRVPLSVRVGSEWCWMPLSKTAKVIVRVSNVKWDGEEWLVETLALDSAAKGEYAWNALERFIEACVLIEPVNV